MKKRYYILILTILVLSFSCRKDKVDLPTNKDSSEKTYRVLNVPTQFATIQMAVNAAGENDTVKVLAGRYRERLVINKSVNIVGAGADKTQIAISGDLASPTFEEVVLVQSNSADKINVSILNMEIVGGNWTPINNTGYFAGSTPFGLHVRNAKITLKNIVVNQCRNFFVYIRDSEAEIDKMDLYTAKILSQTDVGVLIINSKVKINRLSNAEPQIDHIIDINHPLFKSTTNDFSEVNVTNCNIKTSLLNWGDGIRLGVNTKLDVSYCNISRPEGGAPMNDIPNTGINIETPKNSVTISHTNIDNLPVGLWLEQFDFSPIKIENCTIKNCDIGSRVQIYDRGTVDFGGGTLGSKGGNIFQNNKSYDLFLDRTSLNISALHNQWSDVTNPDNKIYDRVDKDILGKVVY